MSYATFSYHRYDDLQLQVRRMRGNPFQKGLRELRPGGGTQVGRYFAGG